MRTDEELIGLFAAAKESSKRASKIIDELRDRVIALIEEKGYEDETGKTVITTNNVEVSLSTATSYSFVDDFESILKRSLTEQEYEALLVSVIDTSKIDEYLHSGILSDEVYLSLKKANKTKRLNYRSIS